MRSAAAGRTARAHVHVSRVLFSRYLYNGKYVDYCLVKVFGNVSKIALSSAPRMLFRRLILSADSLLTDAMFALNNTPLHIYTVIHIYHESCPVQPEGGQARWEDQ